MGTVDFLDESVIVKNKILDLLAIIHRDNGAYTNKYGIIKSLTDATTELLRMKQKMAENRLL